ncbi:hypothetical protein MJO28_001986 [Puccinia striiformis f. sp. tritici]|uniref:Uncharacterized protein n=1 Tax=Puccinia striiformis f. sp. tritici TaxID=168172 RepID=A0ACC0EVW3_9BASI|nr:hypothetical protein MJO28_001986 [Puccinia striiformis f. sp. tritici]
MAFCLLFLLLTGRIFGFDSAQPEVIRPSLGQFVEPAHGGDESLPSFHAITIEPCFRTGSPPILSPSALSTLTPAPVHCDSNEPGTAELQKVVTERPMWDQIPRPSSEGSSTRVLDNPRGPNWIECAVCLIEFDITALDDEKLVPGQPPLRKLVACHHTFHQECIDQWLRDPRKTCPHCRAPSKDDGIFRLNPGPDLSGPIGSNFQRDVDRRIIDSHGNIVYSEPCFLRYVIPVLGSLFWVILILVLLHLSHIYHWHVV